MKIDYVNSLITDLRKCSRADCEGVRCNGEHCDEHENRVMREAADALERCAELENLTERTHTTLQIIRLVQRATSDVVDLLDIDDDAGTLVAYMVERGIVAELVKEGEERESVGGM